MTKYPRCGRWWSASRCSAALGPPRVPTHHREHRRPSSRSSVSGAGSDFCPHGAEHRSEQRWSTSGAVAATPRHDFRRRLRGVCRSRAAQCETAPASGVCLGLSWSPDEFCNVNAATVSLTQLPAWIRHTIRQQKSACPLSQFAHKTVRRTVAVSWTATDMLRPDRHLARALGGSPSALESARCVATASRPRARLAHRAGLRLHSAVSSERNCEAAARRQVRSRMLLLGCLFPFFGGRGKTLSFASRFDSLTRDTHPPCQTIRCRSTSSRPTCAQVPLERMRTARRQTTPGMRLHNRAELTAAAREISSTRIRITPPTVFASPLSDCSRTREGALTRQRFSGLLQPARTDPIC